MLNLNDFFCENRIVANFDFGTPLQILAKTTRFY